MDKPKQAVEFNQWYEFNTKTEQYHFITHARLAYNIEMSHDRFKEFLTDSKFLSIVNVKDVVHLLARASIDKSEGLNVKMYNKYRMFFVSKIEIDKWYQFRSTTDKELFLNNAKSQYNAKIRDELILTIPVLRVVRDFEEREFFLAGVTFMMQRDEIEYYEPDRLNGRGIEKDTDQKELNMNNDEQVKSVLAIVNTYAVMTEDRMRREHDRGLDDILFHTICGKSLKDFERDAREFSPDYILHPQDLMGLHLMSEIEQKAYHNCQNEFEDKLVEHREQISLVSNLIRSADDHKERMAILYEYGIVKKPAKGTK